MIATEIPAAINPYSIAVAAESSLAKRVNKFFMGIPWTDHLACLSGSPAAAEPIGF